MKLLTSFLFVLFAGVAHAGDGSFLLYIASNNVPQVSATLKKQADFLAVSIDLSSDKSDPAERSAAVGVAKRLLESEVTKQKGWQIYKGAVTISANRTSKFSSSSGSGAQTQANLTLLVPLTEATDVFSTSEAVMRFIAQQSFQDKVEANIGSLTLAVKDPQQYRPELLKLIGADIAQAIQSVAPTGVARVEGLSSAIAVRQLNDREVELYIDYRFTIEKK